LIILSNIDMDILSSDLVVAVQLLLVVVVVRGIQGHHQKHVTLAAQITVTYIM
jgi:hypothetical protein